MQNINSIISALNKEKQRRENIKNKFDWELLARPEQKIPSGNWFGWFIMAGRGFGKTRTGAETVKQFALSGQYKRICLLAETYDQARSIMLEGESGLLNIHRKEEMPKYLPSKKQLIWPNGSMAFCYSAENYEALRGPQFDLAWVDELAKFDNAQEVWDQLMFCLRLGSEPKVIITSTPRQKKIIEELMNRKDIHLTMGSTFDNSQNLSKTFLEMLKNQYEDTKMAQQEIEGKLILDNDEKLWNPSSLKYEKLSQEELEKLNIIVAIDPAVSTGKNSNETGIVVAGKSENNEYYVIEDASCFAKPEIWANKAFELFKQYHAKEIIVETNQGGDILISMLNSFAQAPWKSVRAKESKYQRAFPISQLYQQGKVKHIKKFEKLEEQLFNAHITFSDDRLDALVWSIYYLMQNKNIEPEKTFWNSWVEESNDFF